MKDSASTTLTHPERLVYAAEGITKAAVAAYYERVMDRLLPGIRGRPLSVLRCPEGAGRPCFFQKHRISGLHRAVTVRIPEQDGRPADYLVVDDAAAVLELVQFNVLEFHPWGARAAEPERADRVVFDLDPDAGLPWAEVRAAARALRGLLEGLGLRSFLRTSGGKGLHLVVPLAPAGDWGSVKSFAHAVAQSLAGMAPERYVAVASKRARRGRVFIDYLRNSRGATSVASYSLRARAGAPVAVPVAWEELSRLRGADAWTLKTLPARLARQREDPWKELDSVRQSLDAVLALLPHRG